MNCILRLVQKHIKKRKRRYLSRRQERKMESLGTNRSVVLSFTAKL